jgi:hypothetical protein
METHAGGLTLLTPETIDAYHALWSDDGLWEDVQRLAARFWVAGDDERHVRWHHLVLAVGNFKRQGGTRLWPASVPDCPTGEARPQDRIAPPGLGPFVLAENEPDTWSGFQARFRGMGLVTTTTLLTALWPDSHLIYDRRVHNAAIGLRLAAGGAHADDIRTLTPMSFATYQVVREWVRVTAGTRRGVVAVERALYMLDQEVTRRVQRLRTWPEYAEELRAAVAATSRVTPQA